MQQTHIYRQCYFIPELERNSIYLRQVMQSSRCHLKVDVQTTFDYITLTLNQICSWYRNIIKLWSIFKLVDWEMN